MLLLVTKRRTVGERCQQITGAQITSIPRWDSSAIARSELLLVDAHALTPGETSMLRVFSRLPLRQPIVLIDDGLMARADLALLAVDHLVPDSRLSELPAAVEAGSRVARLQEYHRLLVRSVEHRPQLRRAIGVLFSGNVDLCRMKRLAAATGVSERTLRAQWRNQTRGKVRLSDLARLVKFFLTTADRRLANTALQDLDALCAACIDPLPVFSVDSDVERVTLEVRCHA